VRILPSHGGQSRSTEDGQYTQGPPELVIEIAHATRAIDFHRKRRDYTHYGVLEYLVMNLEESELRRFDLNGVMHMPLSTVLFTYEGHTPGVKSADNATIVLGPRGQPCPTRGDTETTPPISSALNSFGIR
jgi:hypothetical protein